MGPNKLHEKDSRNALESFFVLSLRYSSQVSYDKPRQCTKKQRHHFANKGLYSQNYGFSSSHVWMWELDHKENRVRKNWCFWTVACWRRCLRVSWTSRGSNQSILKEINPEYSLEKLMLKLKLQYFGHLLWTDDIGKVIEKVPDAGKGWGQKVKRASEVRGLDGSTKFNEHELGKNSGSWWATGRPCVLQPMGPQTGRHEWATVQQKKSKNDH